MKKIFAAHTASAIAAALLALTITGCGSLPANMAPDLSAPARGAF